MSRIGSHAGYMFQLKFSHSAFRTGLDSLVARARTTVSELLPSTCVRFVYSEHVTFDFAADVRLS